MLHPPLCPPPLKTMILTWLTVTSEIIIWLWHFLSSTVNTFLDNTSRKLNFKDVILHTVIKNQKGKNHTAFSELQRQVCSFFGFLRMNFPRLCVADCARISYVDINAIYSRIGVQTGAWFIYQSNQPQISWTWIVTTYSATRELQWRWNQYHCHSIWDEIPKQSIRMNRKFCYYNLSYKH